LVLDVNVKFPLPIAPNIFHKVNGLQST